MNHEKPALRRCGSAAVPGPGSWRLKDTIDRIGFGMPARFRWTARAVRKFASILSGAPIPVAWLRGPAYPSGRPSTLLVAGEEPWVEYLPRRFFSDSPVRERIGKTRVWALPGLLRTLRPHADLTIARVDRLSGWIWFRRDYLSVPEWIGARMALDEDTLSRTMKGKSVREDLRRVRSRGLSYSVSHRDSDFDLFFARMYLPYARARFGDMAGTGEANYLRHSFRRGGVLFVEQGGVRLAGLLYSRRRELLRLGVVGTWNGEAEPVKWGALAALDAFAIRHARSMGCTVLDLGGSRPVLQDGVLRFKAKWRPRLWDDGAYPVEMRVHWNHLRGVVADFFSHTSIIFREKDGLAAIHTPAGSGAAAAAGARALWIGGLRRLYLPVHEGQLPGFEPPPGAVFLGSASKPGRFERAGEGRVPCS